MIKYKICSGSEVEKSQLVNLWITSFGEEKTAVDLFFDSMFKNAVCFVACDDNDEKDEKIVASLYLLKSSISGGYSLNGYYLYAAATLPSYRNRGIMGNLINTAADFARNDGKDYIALLPAKGTLYEFYKINDFCECYGTVDLSVNLNKLKQYSPLKIEKDFPTCDFKTMSALRERIFSSFPHLGFDESHIKYSAVYNGYYGAKFICSINGYAIYFESPINNGDTTEVFVTEIAFPSDKIGDYLSCIVQNSENSCKKLTVRLSIKIANDNKNLFAEHIQPKRFAMIKPINSKIDFNDLRKNIYFGLTLE